MVRFLSLNVRGLASDEKRRSIFEYCRKRGDIILLQETHSVKENEQIWKNEWGGPIFFAHGAHDARGVCTMIGPKLSGNCKNISKFVDQQGKNVSHRNEDK